MQMSSAPTPTDSPMEKNPCGIGTLNESTLHRQLKEQFAPSGSTFETKLEGYICDILTPEQSVIEIQTANLSRLRNKLTVLPENHKMEVVFPIAQNNYILVQERGLSQAEIPRRKSPKHKTLFSMFREITGCYFLLDHPNLVLRLLFVDIETVKIVVGTDKRGRKQYKIIDKKLLNINGEKIITQLSDLTAPLLEQLPDRFFSSDLKKITGTKDGSFALWVLKKAGYIHAAKRDGRKIQYAKNAASC